MLEEGFWRRRRLRGFPRESLRLWLWRGRFLRLSLLLFPAVCISVFSPEGGAGNPNCHSCFPYSSVAGPDDFNRYSYFFVRLYCTGLGFQANIVEEFVPLSASQHIFAGLKRTRDQKLSSGLKSGQLNLSSLFQRRGTCAVECVAAHLCGCCAACSIVVFDGLPERSLPVAKGAP